MPTIAEFDATSTPRIEIQKCQALLYKVTNNYEASAARTSAINALETLISNWETQYQTDLAAADIDSFPSSITTQVSALQTTYNNRNA